ncbi:LysR substrate-binding domain-containing protein [Dinoroseobacter sp. S76]|uniref:LysR substrate-binding domain-containing protein n=1 Tax=Dinoroseobacter sp. S76 TaxID=3415124 RepID=UPI003C7B7820
MSYDWKTLPSLTALKAFDATATYGGFAKAARALNVTDAAIAQQVRALEAELGVRLTIRQGRHIRLTEQGKGLAIGLTSAFQIIGDEIASLREATRRKGLRVTTSPYLADKLIVPNLSEFWRKTPGAEISLSPSRDFVDVVRDGYDLAIRAFPQKDTPDWPGTDVLRIADVPITAVCAASVAENAGNDVHKMPWLWHDGMSVKVEMMRDCGIQVDKIKCVRIGSPNLLLEATRQGLGATLFNAQIAQEVLKDDTLVEVEPPMKAMLTYYAVLPKGPRHYLTDQFVDWVGSLM